MVYRSKCLFLGPAVITSCNSKLLKLNVSLIASVLVSLTLIMEKRSKQPKRHPRTSTPLFRFSSRHSRGFLEDHSISQENPTRFVYSTVSFVKSLTKFIKGRYLPVFASEIIDRNGVAIREGRPTINLKSVVIGNGITDISTFVIHILTSQRIHYKLFHRLYQGRYEVECSTASLPIPFQSISNCVRMKAAVRLFSIIKHPSSSLISSTPPKKYVANNSFHDVKWQCRNRV